MEVEQGFFISTKSIDIDERAWVSWTARGEGHFYCQYRDITIGNVGTSSLSTTSLLLMLLSNEATVLEAVLLVSAISIGDVVLAMRMRGDS